MPVIDSRAAGRLLENYVYFMLLRSTSSVFLVWLVMYNVLLSPFSALVGLYISGLHYGSTEVSGV